MTKPTGRPKGRPPKHIVGQRIAKRVTSDVVPDPKPAAVVRLFPELTDDELHKLTPCDVFQRAMIFGLKRGDLNLALYAADRWAPFVHPKAQAPVWLSPEDLRRVAELARAEAGRRGYDVEATAEPAARAGDDRPGLASPASSSAPASDGTD